MMPYIHDAVVFPSNFTFYTRLSLHIMNVARPSKLIVYFWLSNVYSVGRVITHSGVKNGMYEMLIMRKTEVIIRCGTDEVQGSHFAVLSRISAFKNKQHYDSNHVN